MVGSENYSVNLLCREVARGVLHKSHYRMKKASISSHDHSLTGLHIHWLLMS